MYEHYDKFDKSELRYFNVYQRLNLCNNRHQGQRYIGNIYLHFVISFNYDYLSRLHFMTNK